MGTLHLSYHHPRNGAQEDGVGGQVRCEAIATLQQIPWTYGKPNDGGDVTPSSDILQICHMK